MGEVASGGRTIVFVSHQLNQIRRLCEKAIWLDQGKILRVGPTSEVAGAYEVSMSRRPEEAKDNGSTPKVHDGFVSWEIVEPRVEKTGLLTTLGRVKVKFVLRLDKPVADGHHGIALFNLDRQLIWAQATNRLELAAGIHEFWYEFPSLPIRPGLYNWEVSLFDGAKQIDIWSCVPEMTVATEVHQHPEDRWNGVLNLPCRFSAERGAVHVQTFHI
jgi:hypothetical protein